ncbi:NAD-dependent epimerase/dehydratase family protein [Actinopolymorpha alba]|uniref:NAD-dependent epimerase/dehydratase family protein n=1 Tax=Actinopolymorpha alba TaxID=533267 RepID=UPI000379936B|nr:NAD(P)-dependent oxidoreductase [Actinopolymorpha alba]
MRILVTGAGGNIGKGIVPRLHAAGHSLVLSDVNRLPDEPPFADLPFVQCDVQAGFGLEGAAQGCDLLLHLPAWHGIHSRAKTEADFWRLNVDGTFWALQAARAAGIRRLVFLSSQSWHDHYGKYGFTKQVGEELCEYHRRNHGLRYVAIRPADFTPWGDDYLNRYGARLLYGGVDREDVLGYVEAAVEHLGPDLPDGGSPEALIVDAVRPDAFTAEQVRDWEDDHLTACERVFPGSRDLLERYAIDVRRRPSVVAGGEDGPGAAIGYTPTRHFGTFLDDLRRLDATGEPDAVRAITCPY